MSIYGSFFEETDEGNWKSVDGRYRADWLPCRVSGSYSCRWVVRGPEGQRILTSDFRDLVPWMNAVAAANAPVA